MSEQDLINTAPTAPTKDGDYPPPTLDGSYIPGPPPDYLAAVSMDEYGPPSYTSPDVQGLDFEDQAATARKSGLPRLAYADFLPYCFRPGDSESGKLPVFDSFKGLVKFANSWLEQNRHYSILHIENIEMKVGYDGQMVEDGKTIEHFASFGNNGVLGGIRLWLVPNPDQTAPAERLAYFNWVPEEDPIEQDVYVGHGRRGLGMMTKHTILIPNFKGLDHTLNTLNARLRDNPIPGPVKSVQTVELIYQKDAWGPKCINPDLSCHFSYGHKQKLFLQFLRVFYVIGPPTPCTIELMDFVPEVARKRRGSINKPQFETFEPVFQRASSWVSRNDAQNVRVLNIQSVDMKCNWLDMLRCVEGDVIVDPKVTWYRESSETVFVRIMRVACLKIQAPEGRTPLTMSSRLFMPVRTGQKSAENIPQTVFRINAWLDLTESPICGITTEKFQFEPESTVAAVKPDNCSYTVKTGRALYMATGLRLLLGNSFKEPDPSQLPPAEEYGRKSSSCTLM